MKIENISIKANKRLIKRMEHIISIELDILKAEKMVNKSLEGEYQDLLNNKQNIEKILKELETSPDEQILGSVTLEIN